MTLSELKDKLRIFDHTELNDLVKDKHEKEAKQKAKSDKDGDGNNSDSEDEDKKKMAEVFVALLKSNKYQVKYTGKCSYCHIPGHKEENCYKKKRDEGKDAGGYKGPKCFNCGKHGHKAASCWHSKSNQEAYDISHFFGCAETTEQGGSNTNSDGKVDDNGSVKD